MIALFFLISFSVFAKTEVAFVDACSKKEVRVSNPNGIKLKVDISKLDPTDELELTVIFRPAGIIEDLKPNDQVIRTFRFGANGNRGVLGRNIDVKADGTLSTLITLPKEKWMWQVEQRHSEYRIWDAEVKWTQHRARKAGTDISTFYRAPSYESFFQLQSGGLCQWESEAEVSSKLYENNTTTWMNVSRQRVQMWDQSTGPGITLGYNNNTGGSQPLGGGAQSTAIMGWLFKDWQKQLTSQQIFSFERKYVLNKEETGLFISRMTFNRHEVKRFEWDQTAGACGDYVVTSEGHLDIGQTSEDFIILPKNFYPRPEKLRAFINTVRAAFNNCGPTELTGPQNATDLIPAGTHGILYYYELKNNRGML